MKSSPFLLITLVLAVCFGCSNKQQVTRESPEGEETQEQAQGPEKTLPPLRSVNERLDGTVWVTSAEMWEDIPIGDVIVVYTFSDREMFRYTASNHEHGPEEYPLTVSYTVSAPDRISFRVENSIRYIRFSDNQSHLILTNTFAETHPSVLSGEAKPGEIFQTQYLFPSDLEFINRDYTKTLTLEGTRWKNYAEQNSRKEVIYSYPDNPQNLIINEVYDDNSNVLYFDNGMCSTGSKRTFVKYTITPKSIIIEPSPYDEPDSPPIIAIIKDKRLIFTSNRYRASGYIRIHS